MFVIEMNPKIADFAETILRSADQRYQSRHICFVCVTLKLPVSLCVILLTLTKIILIMLFIYVMVLLTLIKYFISLPCKKRLIHYLNLNQIEIIFSIRY